jgi:hypothetical protein
MLNSEEKKILAGSRVVRKKFWTEKSIAPSPILKLNGWSLKWCMQSESKNVVFKIKLYDIKMIYATDMGSLLNPVQVLICMLYLSFFCG